MQKEQHLLEDIPPGMSLSEWEDSIPHSLKLQPDRLDMVAAYLKERLSDVPFHAKRAQREGESYWRRLAGSCPYLLGR